mmetsp:Transcript_24518/g.62504  ORF Transcript_24518/g.62504 Transcript_24518/m.62504 type:complete len:250 (-) Transcript_24518:63-812(-)
MSFPNRIRTQKKNTVASERPRRLSMNRLSLLVFERGASSGPHNVFNDLGPWDSADVNERLAERIRGSVMSMDALEEQIHGPDCSRGARRFELRHVRWDLATRDVLQARRRCDQAAESVHAWCVAIPPRRLRQLRLRLRRLHPLRAPPLALNVRLQRLHILWDAGHIERVMWLTRSALLAPLMLLLLLLLLLRSVVKFCRRLTGKACGLGDVDAHALALAATTTVRAVAGVVVPAAVEAIRHGAGGELAT